MDVGNINVSGSHSHQKHVYLRTRVTWASWESRQLEHAWQPEPAGPDSSLSWPSLVEKNFPSSCACALAGCPVLLTLSWLTRIPRTGCVESCLLTGSRRLLAPFACSAALSRAVFSRLI